LRLLDGELGLLRAFDAFELLAESFAVGGLLRTEGFDVGVVLPKTGADKLGFFRQGDLKGRDDGGHGLIVNFQRPERFHQGFRLELLDADQLIAQPLHGPPSFDGASLDVRQLLVNVRREHAALFRIGVRDALVISDFGGFLVELPYFQLLVVEFLAHLSESIGHILLHLVLPHVAVNDGDGVGDVGRELFVGIVNAHFDQRRVALFLDDHGPLERTRHPLE
jgi:hypothetical protein